MTSRPASRLGLILILALVLSGPLAFPADAAADGAASAGADASAQGGGYYYVVKYGDTWSTVSAKTGVSFAKLRAANPQAIRRSGWLLVGEQLYIPVDAPPTPKASCQIGVNGYAYTVKYGDTWAILAGATGVPMAELWQANPTISSRATKWLISGERLCIPGTAPSAAAQPTRPAPTPAPTREPSPTRAPTEPPTATPTPVPTAQFTPTGAPTASPTAVATGPSAGASGVPTATLPSGVAAGSTPVPTLTPAGAQPLPALTPAAVSGRAPACPATFDAYPAAIANFIQASGRTPAMLQSWLESCGVVQEERGGVTMAAIQTPTRTADDLVVIIHDTKADELFPQGTMLVYFNTAKGYVLAGQAEGTGSLGLLATRDLNRDGKVDVFYTDGTCGAHTCFYTLFLYSWDGVAFRDWIEGEPTMAYPVYTIADRTTAGDGEEIVAYGGVIGSAGAGPQRAHTETWGSPQGAPYKLLSDVYDKSTCLYHQILDANKLFDEWTTTGFGPALTAYQKALDDSTLGTCGDIKDELAVLRDFARLRMVIGNLASGRSAQATRLGDEIKTPAVAAAATAFLDSYRTSRSIIQACRDLTAYAEAHPASWNYLENWGYANPSFTAQDVCPLAN